MLREKVIDDRSEHGQSVHHMIMPGHDDTIESFRKYELAVDKKDAPKT